MSTIFSCPELWILNSKCLGLYNWATFSLGDTNTETWYSNLGVGHKAHDSKIFLHYRQSVLIMFRKIIIACSGNRGHVTAQNVSRRLPNSAARVRAQVRSCENYGEESGTGAGYLRVLQFPLPILIQGVIILTKMRKHSSVCMCNNQCMLRYERCSCDPYSRCSTWFPCISTQLSALLPTEMSSLPSIPGFTRLLTRIFSSS
jgi:hypothetical protein